MLGTDNPEAAAARAQLRGLLERAVDDLPASFRLVFVMRDLEEMSVEETAAHLKLKPETVRTRLFRALHHADKKRPPRRAAQVGRKRPRRAATPKGYSRCCTAQFSSGLSKPRLV